jgi:hypothetical protein
VRNEIKCKEKHNEIVRNEIKCKEKHNEIVRNEIKCKENQRDLSNQHCLDYFENLIPQQPASVCVT